MHTDCRDTGADKARGDSAPLVGGLAVDVDETLGWTVGLWFRLLSERFGNPENLSPRQFEAKYEFTYRVSYWQAQDVNEFMDQQRSDPNRQLEVELMPGAVEGMRAIRACGQELDCYLTTRPQCVSEATALWARRNGLPDLPVTAKPDEIPFSQGNQWKVDVLLKLFPKVGGIIDNSGDLINLIPADYPGLVFHFGANARIREDLGDRLIPCATWADVAREVGIQHARNLSA